MHAMAMGVRGFARPAVPDYTYSMVKSGPEVDPDEVEVAHTAAIEVVVLWGANVLHVSHLTPPRSFYVGEESSAAGCDYVLPSETLGARRAPVVVSDGNDASLVILPGARGHVDIPGQGRIGVDELVASRRVRPCVHVAGAHEVVLPPGAKARLELAGSPLAFQVSIVNAGKRLPPVFADTDPSALVYSGMSLLLHVGLIAMFAFFMPSMRGDDSEALDRDQILTMQRLLSAAAEREQEAPPPDEAQASTAASEGGSGVQAKGESGAAGTPNTRETGHRFAVAGPKDNPDTHLASKALLSEAASFGMIGILSSAMTDPNAPVAPWGRQDSSGNEARSALGNMFGGDIGDAIGTGGLGLLGDGEGGGGPGEGIGMDGFGGLGNGAGGGPGSGIGHGNGLPGRGHPVHGPTVREVSIDVNGRLPPEVIQRIVRQNFGRFRLCYETGMRTNPALTGRVAVKFIIDRSGSVAMARDGGSDLPDQSVVQCVVKGFTNLSFPEPQNGMVTVVYPIVFSPGQ
jgi:hypothetical protein